MKKILLFFFYFFSISFINAQNFEWAKNFIEAYYVSEDKSISVDSAGNVYVVGSFIDTVDFDPGAGVYNLYPIPQVDPISLYILKLNAAGDFLWAKQVDGVALPTGTSNITLDAFGNICLGGVFSGIVDFDPGAGVYNLNSIGGLADYFILKLNSNGDFVWAKQIGTTNTDDNPVSIAADDSNNVYITGSVVIGNIDLNPGLGINNMDYLNGRGFIIKLNANGDYVWSKQFGGNDNYILPRGIEIDNNGSVYSTGVFYGFSNFDYGITNFILYPFGDEDVYVYKIDSLGNFVWAKQMGGVSFDRAFSIALDNDANVFTTGCFNSTNADFDPGTGVFNLTQGAITTIFISKLDSNGNFVWAKSMGGTGPSNNYPKSITTDSYGSCYLTGSFEGSGDFNPGAGSNILTSNGGEDVFVTKLDSLGNYVWAYSFGDFGPELGHSAYIDNAGNIYIAALSATGGASMDVDPQASSFLVSSGTSLIKWSQNLCSSLTLVVDSIKNAGCISTGFSSVHTLNGIAPYTYVWNLSPVVTDSFANITIAGIYQVTVTDAYNCSRSTSVIINGPLLSGGFDLNTNLVSTDFRTGFSSQIWLDAFNEGCVSTSGDLKLILDSLVVFSSAIPSPDIINGDTLIWNFSNLTYDSIHIIPQITVQTPVWAVIGDTVCFKTIISPVAGDIDTTNNIKQYCFPIINGYDPNEKTVYPIGECTPGYVNDDNVLTYTVRFQNTGNASAINIYVLDTLDMDLNLNTVRVIGNSHSVITEVLPGNVLKFKFDNINLADSTSNEAASHGYVIFEVLPNTGLPNGTPITNTVAIYFDFNPPIFTNTVLNTISDGTFNSGVVVSGNSMTANLSGGTYQWLNCDNGNSIIAGATNQTYTITASGNYAVIINDGCFVDTSVCTTVSLIGISEIENRNQFSFYPNPSNNSITITAIEPTQIKIINMLGEVVIEKQVQNNTVIDINNLSNGIYFIQTKEGYSTKLIKN